MVGRSNQFGPRHRSLPWLGLTLAVLSASEALAGPLRIKTGPESGFSRASVQFQVGGTLEPAALAKPLPLSVVAQFEFVDRPVEVAGESRQRHAFRHYSQAKAAIKVGTQATLSELSSDRRQMRVAASSASVSIRAAKGTLSRDELDLLEIPGNPLILDRFAPPKVNVKAGDNWDPGPEAWAVLLGLESVAKSTAKCRLTSFTDETGEITLEGTVEGQVAGTATKIELLGKLVVDRHAERVQSLNLAIKEKRSTGVLSPGLDVNAKLQLQITTVAEYEPLAEAALAELKLTDEEGHPRLEYRPAAGDFALLYDERWRTHRDEKTLLVLRLVDQGDLLAQCNLSSLARVEPNQAPTLSAFQQEVQEALGKNFAQFESAHESKRPSGTVVYRTTAHGTVAEVPIIWHYYLLLDSAKRRIAVSFTLEAKWAERFADADRLFIESLEFVPEKTAATTKTSR